MHRRGVGAAALHPLLPVSPQARAWAWWPLLQAARQDSQAGRPICSYWTCGYGEGSVMEKLKPVDPIWAPVRDWPGIEVSRDGRVRSWRIPGSKTRIATVPHELKLRRSGPYLAVGTSTHGKYAKRFIHRLVLEAFVGPCPLGMESRHIDGDSHNNDLSNLGWATKAENENDKVRHGTHLVGSRSMRRKLDPDQVLAIRAAHKHGASLASLGRSHGVTWQSIQAIIRRKSWAWL